MSKWVMAVYVVLILTGIAAITLVWCDPNPPSKTECTLWVLIALTWITTSFIKEYRERK